MPAQGQKRGRGKDLTQVLERRAAVAAAELVAARQKAAKGKALKRAPPNDHTPRARRLASVLKNFKHVDNVSETVSAFLKRSCVVVCNFSTTLGLFK